MINNKKDMQNNAFAVSIGNNSENILFISKIIYLFTLVAYLDLNLGGRLIGFFID